MKLKELTLLAGLGLLVTPFAQATESPWAPSFDHRLYKPAPFSMNQVRELPVFELEPSSISVRTADLYFKNAFGVARHVFFERTTHSLTLGARVEW